MNDRHDKRREWAVGPGRPRRGLAYRPLPVCGGARLRRALDSVIAGLGLVLLSPLGLGVALLLRLISRNPVLFHQMRIGWGERPFTLVKFRTMNEDRDALGNLLPDEQRLTRFGRLLRSTSLDELPQLINVLRGEMSLVGPRPLLPEYLVRYSDEQRRRHEVPPGLTGWAQIHGRNAITWEQTLALDLWYVNHRSFILDIKILLMTPLKVLLREGTSATGRASMPASRRSGAAV